MNNATFDLYRGDPHASAPEQPHAPLFIEPPQLHSAAGYVADEGLRDAVNVAIALGQPLLVTGEPGTGKTELAASVASDLGLGKPLVFNVKSTSTARDLFYAYDAPGHFRSPAGTDAMRFIEYSALGLAILLAKPATEGDLHLPARYHGRGPIRSVVLIDEIDKAPRDLPNDVLNEFVEMKFTVRETNPQLHFEADAAYRPILFLTSNSERNLPDAFLRRCVFYAIPFVEDKDHLRNIIQNRLPPEVLAHSAIIEATLEEFLRIRKLGLKKPPATSELLGWARVLAQLQINPAQPLDQQKAALRASYSVLAKSKEDLDRVQKSFPPALK